MKTKLLTFLLALTFLFLFIGSSVVFTDDLQDGLEASDQEVQDDVWTAEQTESVGVVASVNGRIVHGDRFKIIIEKK
jgi:hypothetical protein